ncbi:MAG TPA: Holliday junction branch migration protein RuvA [Desulfobacterales bacterium]|nr:Holliday junction branch migration protein RuvA [Desulfobacterales bacterium]
MIAHLRGQIFKKSTQSVIIETGGIGYEVLVPLSTFYSLPDQAQDVSLHIHTHVREDAILLFGFLSTLEKELFLMLISVSGIGPKLAVNILSGIGPEELLEAISSGDSLRLRSIPGVGKKTADRIVVELREKAQKFGGDREIIAPPMPQDPVISDAISALTNLGYPLKSAKKAVEQAARQKGSGSLEELIKEALKALG